MAKQEKTVRQQKEEEIDRMNLEKLKSECAKEGIRWEGSREEMAKKLLLRRYGSRKKYIPGLTICQVCSAEVRVVGTATEEYEGDMLIVTRQVKCLGKGCHSYPLREVIEKNKDKSPAEPAARA